MKALASREAKNSFGHLMDVAQIEPVSISKHGHPVAVMLSHDDYERMAFAEKALLTNMTGLSAEAFKHRTSLLTQLRKHAPVLDTIVKKYGGSHLRVFGSVAHEAETIFSDVDLLIDYPENHNLSALLGLGPTLEDIIGRKVDVVPTHKLNKYIRETALREAIEL